MINHRRDVRYELRQEVHLSIRVPATDGPAAPDLNGIAVDLSKRGVKARMRESLPIGQKLDVQLRFPAIAVIFDSPATVCWTRPAGQESCWLGVTLEREIPRDIWQQLSNHGFIDRRMYPRSETSQPAFARRELSGEIVPIVLLDLSQGGCRFRTEFPLQEGERFLLGVREDESRERCIMVRVAWARESCGNMLVGCEFTGRDGFAELRRKLRVRQEDACDPQHAMRKRTDRRAISLLAAVASIASLLLWWIAAR